MTTHKIGKIVSVSGDNVDIELIDFVEKEGSCLGVPENMCIDITTSGGGPKPLHIGQPGSFVKIDLPEGQLIAMVYTIKMREASISSKQAKEIEEQEEYSFDYPIRIISTIPVGTIDSSGKFERGTDVLPTVNSSVYAVSNETIEKIYKSYASGEFQLGTLSLIQNQPARIDLNAFLSRHTAIIGQTGGGKSWTVASLLQKIIKFPQSTLILFDIHGEYKTAFTGAECDYLDVKELEFPYWLMNFQELTGLMVDLSENQAPNQIAKFRELLQAAKESEENKALKIPKITVDTPVHFEFKKIIEEFRLLNTQMVPGARGEKQGPLFGEFTRLLTRIDSRLNDKRYDLIFQPKKYTTSASMEELFRKILGKLKGGLKKIVVIDISPIPMEVRNSVISLILRCIFDFGYWYKRVNKKTFPIGVFCDEAHVYLNDKDSSSEPARLSAERIAKEGRKYGINLTVISQRPREVSSTILSQCNTFMCLRITNPDDQIYVKNLLPDSVRGIVSMFSTLRRGECILLGDSVIMPTRIKLDPPDPKPSSDDTKFFEEWHKNYEEIDFNAVLDSWRKQAD